MIINSRFFLFTYTGKNPLTLFETPSGLTGPDLVRYNTFISSVDSIYASQATSGLIPSFYKTNGQPDSNSSLKILETGKAYYVIMSASAQYPINIPAVGGVAAGIGDAPVAQCSTSQTPTVSFASPSFTIEGEANHYQYLTINFGQLVPKVKYKYTISNFQSNWPIKILPKEGEFTPHSVTENINAYMMFAPTLNETDCSDCFTNYNLDPDFREPFAQNNLYAILEISIVPEPFNVCIPVTDTLMVRCKSCLPRRIENYPVIKFEEGPRKVLTSECASEPVPVYVNCTSFDKGKPYRYELSVDNNVSIVIPDSGIIGFGDGVGKINALLSLNNTTPVVVKALVQAQDGSGKTSTDFLTIECTDCL
jgi:hypothetical protein